MRNRRSASPRARARRARTLVPGLAALVAAAVACGTAGPPSPPEPADAPAAEVRRRHARVEVGWTREQVAAAIGDLPVRRPGHPDAPFPSPLRVAGFTAPSGERIRLEVYVTATRPAEGCPDLVYDDAPVAYVDDRVVATSWEEVEWRWRGWGGELGLLRSLQDRVGECAEPAAPEPGPPEPSAAPPG